MPRTKLRKCAQSTAAPFTAEDQPVSKEDALTARLRILRSQPNNSNGGVGVSQSVGGSGTTTQPSAEPGGTGGKAAEKKGIPQSPSPPTATPTKTGQKPSLYHFLEADADDEDALDELLESLGDEDFDLALDEDLDPLPDLDPRGDAKKVAGVIKSLQKGQVSTEDDDDSDGEHMSRAVESILSQLTDEINALPPPAAAGEDRKPDREQKTPPGEADAKARTTVTTAEADGDHDAAPFTLPAVPSQLVDPAPTATEEEEESDFEKDISARLASLRGLGSPSSLDALGLPSAPTFQPQDNSQPTLGKGPLSSKYTDEDQKTWCVVCLEDATILCVGCDNDVYCARCWREMHVGPAAGYDERGHQWVKFERSKNV